MRADEWPALRGLRLDALRDPDARLAFLDSFADAVQRPDEHWRGRAAASAEGDAAVQLVAVDDHELAGSVTVLVQVAGSQDHHGRRVRHSRAVLVGVYVRPAYRGTGVTDDLIDAAATWSRARGFRELTLDVHRDNARAQGAYRRAGFTPSGVAFTSAIGPEIEMVRAL
ncbi:GNAT family N-acetyltransferase [Cellulomonas sp. URHE0023]|uniref:GNAT family N-acetyltransferase n=1 Tax=Cellulomonas sp. URHE0023 TaxID=1380354 RepID=UPI000ABD3702|nr:GNAT family N-acetyltransferase [Cellulomonas sp. URHE0023]